MSDIISGDGMFVFEEQIPLQFWLIDLINNHPNGVIELSPEELSSWFDALDTFQQHHQNLNNVMYGAPKNPDLNPDAILNLINAACSLNCL